MTKIILAPDKFKGSLSGLEFCRIVERGIRSCVPGLEVIPLPLADGGDGTVDALSYYTGGTTVKCVVSDPLSRPVEASYLWAEQEKMAFIEMASASGMSLLSTEELNPLQASSYGTGELIKNAIERGARRILMGIGGSATNDAGMGMARALGYRFYNKLGEELKGCGADLLKLARIDSREVLPELKEVVFEVACDVENPLYGPDGAAAVYAPQKGATPEMVEQLDEGLRHFAALAEAYFRKDIREVPGGGAAGGMGAGAILFLNAKLLPGIEILKRIARFSEHIRDADWIVTGEGKIDFQTFSGKVIKGIVDERTSQKLAVFCGSSDLTEEQLRKLGVDYFAEIGKQAVSLSDSMKNAALYLEMAARDFARTHLG